MNIRFQSFLSKFCFILSIFFALSISSVFATITITTVDNQGNVGENSSLMLNSQGHPVISYLDSTNHNLKLAVCGNPTCTSGNIIITVDNSGKIGEGVQSSYLSLALNSKNHPVISYSADENLKVAVCGNLTCTSNNVITTIDIGGNPSLTLNSKDYPIISYSFKEIMKIAVCGNSTCTSDNIFTSVVTGYQSHPSLALNSQGYPVISYHSSSSEMIKLAACSNSTCTSDNVFTTVVPNNALFPFLVLSSQDYPVISYAGFSQGEPRLVICNDPNCTSYNSSVLNGDAIQNRDPSLTLNSHDHPIISYYDHENSLKLVICSNLFCTSNTIVPIEKNIGKSTNRVLRNSSIVMNSQDHPVISYYDSINEDLKLAVCDTPTCSDTPNLTLQGNGHPIPNGNSTPTLLDGTDFGSLRIGDTLPHAFTLQNQGGSNLDITQITLTGSTQCAPFTLTPPSLFTLVPSEATTFQLTFSPATLGTFTCPVHIESNDPDENPYTFFVQGQSQIEQDIDIQGQELSIPNQDTTPSSTDGTDFGNVSIGMTPLHTFTIQNIGGSLLTFASPTLQGDSCYPFTLTPPSTRQLAGQETTSFQILFAPPSRGTFTCQVTLSSNDPDENPYTFTIQGTGGEPPHPLPNVFSLFVAVEGPGQVTDHTEQIQCPQSTCQASYSTSTQVMLTPQPNPEAYFSSWGGHPDCSDGEVWMIESKRCVAYFHLLPTLTVSKEGEGQITGEGIDCDPDCTQAYPFNTSITLTATPAPQFQFNAWSGDCAGTASTTTLTIQDRSLICTAHFAPPLTLTISKAGEGQVTAEGLDCGTDCTESYARGTRVTLTATPTAPYHFDHWSGDCTGSSSVLTLPMETDKTCTALFSKDLAGSLPCDYPVTLSSFQNGEWNDPLTWEDITGQHRLPTSTDVILVKHELRASPFVKIHTLCQHGTLHSASRASLEIEAPGGITNYGTIQGEQNCDGGQDVTLKTAEGVQQHDKLGDFWYYTYATPGPLVNHGRILGGHGCEGSSGGQVTILARGITNSGQIEAGRGGESNQGMGGRGGRTQVFGRFGGNEWGSNGYVKSSGSIQGGAGGAGRFGGRGGNLWIVGYPQVFLGPNLDYTDSCLQCSTLNRTGHHAGQGGLGTEANGEPGWVQIEPNTIAIQAGERTEVSGGTVTIFGGDDWTLNLSHASKLLVEATQDLTLAVGKQGMIDFTGNTQPILKATGKVQLFADEIRLDPGITLEQVIQASQVTTGPATLLPSVTLVGSRQLLASPGVPQTVKFTLLNGGPQADTYQVNIHNSATGETQIATVDVPALDSVDLATEVTLVSPNDAQVLIITANSSTHPEATATMQAVVKPEQVIVKKKENGLEAMGKITLGGIPVEGATVTIGQATAITDATGAWLISGLAEGRYRAEVSKDGYQFTSQEVVVDPDQPLAIVAFQGEKFGERIDPPNEQASSVIERNPKLPTQLIESIEIFQQPEEMGILPTNLFEGGIPICPATGWINWTCSNRGRVITEATLGPRAIISGGSLAGVIQNQGFVSQVMIQPGALVSGGMFSGEVINQGTLESFRFVGSVLKGGRLAGTVANESRIGGRLVDVTFAPGAVLQNGKVEGEVQGDQEHPALLEAVRVLAGSRLSGVKLGQGVILEQSVEVQSSER